MNRLRDWILAWRAAPAFSVRMTGGGFLFIVGMVLIALAAFDADANLLLILFGLCFAAVVLSLTMGWRGLRGLAIRRTAPDVIVEGQPFDIRYEVTNRRVWGAVRGIHVADLTPADGPMSAPEGLVPFLRAGETVSLVVPAVASRRGRFEFQRLRLSTRFPFGIFVKRCTHRSPQEVIVFPSLCRLLAELRVTARGRDAALSGGAAGRSRGDEEYYGVREYRRGDNPRRIHWRRSAQTGQLMIREMSKIQDYRIWCVVDTLTEPRSRAQRARLEVAISAAATVVCEALERGTRVGLICNGKPLVVLPPGGGRAYRPRLLRELALRTANHDDTLTAQIERMEWPQRWRGPCVLFAATLHDDVRSAAKALERCCGATTILVPGEASFDSLFAPIRAGAADLEARPDREAA